MLAAASARRALAGRRHRSLSAPDAGAQRPGGCLLHGHRRTRRRAGPAGVLTSAPSPAEYSADVASPGSKSPSATPSGLRKSVRSCSTRVGCWSFPNPIACCRRCARPASTPTWPRWSGLTTARWRSRTLRPRRPCGTPGGATTCSVTSPPAASDRTGPNCSPPRWPCGSGDTRWAHVGLGAMDGLRAVAALGLPMGVVSNSDGSVEGDLRRLGVCHVPAASDGPEPLRPGSPMGVILDSAVVGVAKPDPAIFRIALDALGVPAGRSVLHVGDSLRYDVAGALAAGLQPVHMDPYGFCPAPDGHPHVAQPGRATDPDIESAPSALWPGDDPGPRCLGGPAPLAPLRGHRLRAHALVQDVHPDAARRSGGRRRAQPPPAAARGLHSPADGRALLAAAARPAGPAEGHRDHPRGDERDRRAGDPDAGHAPGRAVAARAAAGS